MIRTKIKLLSNLRNMKRGKKISNTYISRLLHSFPPLEVRNLIYGECDVRHH
ncbi:hypothetical protein DCAR_0519742 [Daucus carota subsp. sativus]|uniref:Uncharacterized protein n=1 Tax=Daucus carota subsp. sativus TaxID=79200 RepID=A0AAF1B0V8_DAUCS|nr:hypothetical protein DCAR_0519742 [Daucus carota subsp. sativus]